MGKSPAKWIKTVLLGKKLSSSHASKGRNASKATNDRGYSGGKGSPALSVASPVISEPVLVSTDSNAITPELEKGASSNLIEVDTLRTSQVAIKQGSAGPEASDDPNRYRVEQAAAIRAQAAFRGFLARRAFRALRGIIRLQALIRGHLVRRQAVATLCSMQAIIKLQALVRGKRVRRTSIGLEINKFFGQMKSTGSKPVETWKEKLATNAYVCKLLSSSPVPMVLQIQYDKGDPNSSYSWLERWTSTLSSKQHSHPKKAIDSKPQSKKGGYKMETESGRPKRAVRRNSAGGLDPGQTSVTSEPEKPKRKPKKVSSSPADSVHEHPQTELEKVKRNLRKVSNLTEASDHPEVEIEKPNHSATKVSNIQSELPSQATSESSEKTKEEVALNPEVKPELESTENLIVVERPLDSQPLQSVGIEENLSMVSLELSLKEEQSCYENPKASKMMASFSAKSEYAENGLQNTPPLPSYMAATESAKAKLRGQGSPRFVSDSVERNDLTRRHSLPSPNIGKMSSNSPRTKRLVQGSSKGGTRGDRSLLSSRDGNDRPIQVEWRR